MFCFIPWRPLQQDRHPHMRQPKPPSGFICLKFGCTDRCNHRHKISEQQAGACAPVAAEENKKALCRHNRTQRRDAQGKSSANKGTGCTSTRNLILQVLPLKIGQNFHIISLCDAALPLCRWSCHLHRLSGAGNTRQPSCYSVFLWHIITWYTAFARGFMGLCGAVFPFMPQTDFLKSNIDFEWSTETGVFLTPNRGWNIALENCIVQQWVF